jgi:UDP:flavonoid glycosyltransferase YjiC (YdhE family)
MSSMPISQQRQAIDFAIAELRIAGAARKISVTANRLEFMINGLLAADLYLRNVEEDQRQSRNEYAYRNHQNR